jgi:hypothetical protein
MSLRGLMCGRWKNGMASGMQRLRQTASSPHATKDSKKKDGGTGNSFPQPYLQGVRHGAPRHSMRRQTALCRFVFRIRPGLRHNPPLQPGFSDDQ